MRADWKGELVVQKNGSVRFVMLRDIRCRETHCVFDCTEFGGVLRKMLRVHSFLIRIASRFCEVSVFRSCCVRLVVSSFDCRDRRGSASSGSRSSSRVQRHLSTMFFGRFSFLGHCARLVPVSTQGVATCPSSFSIFHEVKIFWTVRLSNIRRCHG